MDAILEARGTTKLFPGVRALDNMSPSIAKELFLAFHAVISFSRRLPVRPFLRV